MANDPKKELQVFQNIVSSLSSLGKETQVRMIESVIKFLDIKSVDIVMKAKQALEPIPYIGEKRANKDGFSFSEREDMSPKEFILLKKPKTDIERITCIAYYLTHYRDIPHFKTLDLSKLNTEAAQQKFSNATNASRNATTKGLLVPATKGNKQLSAIGEQFVQALPNREEAKKVLQHLRPRRSKSKRARRKKSTRSGPKV